MNHACNFITVNNPNIPILTQSDHERTPFGEFLVSPTDERNTFDSTVAQMQTRDMYLPNFSIRACQGIFQPEARLVNRDTEGANLLGSCIILRGKIKSLLPHQHDGVESFSGSQNFKYDPHCEYSHVVAANTAFHIVHFSYTFEYFEKFLPENERWADALRCKITNQQRILGDRPVAITLAQEHALQNIFSCRLGGKLGYLMIETFIVQLILLQLHELFHVEQNEPKQLLSNRDRQLMQELKEFLSTSFLDDHSIVNLSRRFGVNTNKLMTLFRTVFNKSIFEFIGDLRMKHAKELILDHGMTVTQVARDVGYKNPNHFSAAFKKHFGVNPSRLK